MNKLFSTLFSAMRARFTSLWTRIRMWTTPTFWRTKVFTKARQFFNQLFDVRPRHKKDYYGVLWWLVSKRLAFAAVVVIGILCIFFLYLTLPKNFFGGKGEVSIRTYKYDAIPLKFYSGTVRILAEDGHLAYQGNVSKSRCTGQGTLFDKDGARVYEGQFENDMYNGVGTLYYPEGVVRYEGDFVNNLFEGKGKYYRPAGTMEYDGAYQASHRNGQGQLFSPSENPIFTGTFQMDEIVYSQFLGKTTAQAAQMYTGTSSVYSSDTEYAVTMDEIGAVYSAVGGTNTLDGEWKVGGITVLSGSFPAETGPITTMNGLTAYFGEPDYYGVSWYTLPEAVAANLLYQTDPELLGSVYLSVSNDFEGVYTVADYDRNRQLYIYDYLKDGLLYTFYCTGAGQDSFVMYTVETAR